MPSPPVENWRLCQSFLERRLPDDEKSGDACRGSRIPTIVIPFPQAIAQLEASHKYEIERCLRRTDVLPLLTPNDSLLADARVGLLDVRRPLECDKVSPVDTAMSNNVYVKGSRVSFEEQLLQDTEEGPLAVKEREEVQPQGRQRSSSSVVQYDSDFLDQHSSSSNSDGIAPTIVGQKSSRPDCIEGPNIDPEPSPSFAARKGKLNKTQTLAFADENTSLRRDQRAAKLRPWFDRLASENNAGLSVLQLIDIVQRVHGRKALSIAEVAEVVHILAGIANHAVYPDCSRSDARHYIELALGFPAFVEMILLDRTYGIVGTAKSNLLIVRNAVMRTHIDEIVAHYSRVEVHQPSDVNTTWINHCMDPCIGSVILIDALVLGISSDIDWAGWDVIELVVKTMMVVEMSVRFLCAGPSKYVFGPDWQWNLFDVVILTISAAEVAYTRLVGAKQVSFGRLIRIVRLARVFRLLRVMRLSMFKELFSMVKGVIGGISTLVWAFVMLLGIVYICGLLLRQTVGRDQHEIQDKYHTVLFGSVPWSMFHAFRCVMSDCSLPDGTPIIGHLYELYGLGFVVPYSCVLVFIYFGIFNLVTAHFVENVLESAKQRELIAKEADSARVGHLLSQLVVHIASKPFDDFTQMNSCSLNTNIQGEVSREDFVAACRNPKVQRIIKELSLQESMLNGPQAFFEALDSDLSGSVSLGEIISGIMQLRSGDTKQDIVALRLATRNIFRMLEQLIEQTE